MAIRIQEVVEKKIEIPKNLSFHDGCEFCTFVKTCSGIDCDDCLFSNKNYDSLLEILKRVEDLDVELK